MEIMENKKKFEYIKGTSDSLYQIGMIYQKKSKYGKALEHYEESMEIKEKIGDLPGNAIGLGQIGDLYLETKDYRKALKYSIMSFLLLSKLGSTNANIVKKNILKVKQTIPVEQFNEILKEFKLPPDIFDEGEKEQGKNNR